MSYYNVEGANQLIFEQQTFKVPYEEFNQSYRINHKVSFSHGSLISHSYSYRTSKDQVTKSDMPQPIYAVS